MPSAPGFVPRFKIQYDVDLTPAERLSRYGLRKATRIAVNRAARVLKGAMVAEGERVRRFGFLAASMRIKVKVYRDEKWVAMAGPSRSYKRVKGKFKRGKRKGQPRKHHPAHTAHFVDEGTKRSRARKLIEGAEAKSIPQFKREVTDELRKELAAELARQRTR